MRVPKAKTLLPAAPVNCAAPTAIVEDDVVAGTAIDDIRAAIGEDDIVTAIAEMMQRIGTWRRHL